MIQAAAVGHNLRIGSRHRALVLSAVTSVVGEFRLRSGVAGYVDQLVCREAMLTQTYLEPAVLILMKGTASF